MDVRNLLPLSKGPFQWSQGYMSQKSQEHWFSWKVAELGRQFARESSAMGVVARE